MAHSPFHIHLYGRCPEGRPPQGARTAPIPTRFDDAQRRLLAEIPHALFEPDGSFAWASVKHQLVGLIYDVGEEIQYIELRGHCSRQQLRQLLTLLCGTSDLDDFGVMVLPERQWKIFHTFEKSVPSEAPESSN